MPGARSAAPPAGAPLWNGATPAVPAWLHYQAGSHILTLLVWTLVVLMIVPDNLDYATLATAASGPTAGGDVSRALWLTLLFAGVAVLLSRPVLAWLVLRQMNVWLLLFAALALASIAWSIEPEVTARRCIRVVTILVDALALAVAGWNPRRFQDVLRPIITLLLAGSLLFGLISPQLAIHQDRSPELLGAWHGLANHKNSLGALAALGLIFWCHAGFENGHSRLAVLFCAAIALACLILSRSSTATVTSIFALALLALLERGPTALRRYLPWLISAFVVLLLLYALAVMHLLPGSNMLLKPIIRLTGKDPSFTGRADIWGLVLDHIRASPFFGTGLGAYWIGPVMSSPSYQFILRLQFYPGSAHNGYLEILNDLGIVGLLCLFGYLLTFLRQALQLVRLDTTQGSLYVALFVQQAMINLSESHWFSVLAIGFVVMTFATASLARLRLDRALRDGFAAHAAAATLRASAPRVEVAHAGAG